MYVTQMRVPSSALTSYANWRVVSAMPAGVLSPPCTTIPEMVACGGWGALVAVVGGAMAGVTESGGPAMRVISGAAAVPRIGGGACCSAVGELVPQPAAVQNPAASNARQSCVDSGCCLLYGISVAGNRLRWRHTA